MEGYSVRRTITPRHPESDAAAKSLGSALSMVQQKLHSSAPPPSIRVIQQKFTPGSSTTATAVPTKRASAMGVSGGLRERNANNHNKKSVVVMEEGGNRVEGLNRAKLEKRSIVTTGRPMMMMESTLGRPSEPESRELLVLLNEKEELQAQCIELKKMIETVTKETTQSFEKKTNEREVIYEQEKQKLMMKLTLERQNHLSSLENLSHQKEEAVKKCTLLETKLNVHDQENQKLQELLNVEIQKKVAIESALEARNDILTNMTGLQEESASLKKALMEANEKLAQQDASILGLLADNRKLQEDANHAEMLLSNVSKTLYQAKVDNTELKFLLHREREKVALQRGYMMKRGINEND